MLDSASGRITCTVPDIPSPNQVAYDPGLNRIYLTNRDQSTLTVLDGATYVVLATVPVGLLPFGVAVNPTTHRVYVASFESARVDVVDGLNNIVLARVSLTNSKPTFVAVDEARNVAYALPAWARSTRLRPTTPPSDGCIWPTPAW